MACKVTTEVVPFIISHCFRKMFKEAEVHIVTGKCKTDIHINNMMFVLQKFTLPKESGLFNKRDYQVLNYSVRKKS